MANDESGKPGATSPERSFANSPAFFVAPGSVRDDVKDAERWRVLRTLFHNVPVGGSMTIERNAAGIMITMEDRHQRTEGVTTELSHDCPSIDGAMDQFIAQIGDAWVNS